jgi:FkbM family methyltransferase
MKKYLEILRQQPTPFRFLAARLLVKTGACRAFAIKRRGYQLRFQPSNLSMQMWIDREAREEELEFFRAFLKPGDHVIDVGANIGDTALAAGVAVGSAGHVWALEAHPRIYQYLCENIRFNNDLNVEAINSAVGEISGKISFSDSKWDDMNKVGNGNLTIPMCRLDDLNFGRQQIALLKIDVEGYEKNVLSGSTMTLRETSCIYFEVSQNNFDSFGYTVQELLSLVESLGFEIFRFAGKNVLARVNPNYEPGKVENLVAVRQADFLKQRTSWQLH